MFESLGHAIARYTVKAPGVWEGESVGVYAGEAMKLKVRLEIKQPNQIVTTATAPGMPEIKATSHKVTKQPKGKRKAKPKK